MRLVEELHKMDPEHWAIVDKKNPRRVVHALEICHQTGKTYTSFRVAEKKQRPFRIIKIGLNRFATPGSEFAKVSIKKNPQLIVNLGKYDVTATNMEVTVKGFAFDTSNHLLKQTGALQVPKVSFPEANVQAYEVTPQWEKQANADYYEVEFDGMRYSTITDNYLRFEDLAAETSYTFRVRAVNKDGQSEWATAQVTTTANPLEFAIQGIKASVTCEDQPGQTVANLFDFDAKSGWHTKWGKGEAVTRAKHGMILRHVREPADTNACELTPVQGSIVGNESILRARPNALSQAGGD